MKKIFRVELLLPLLVIYAGCPLACLIDSSVGSIRWTLFSATCILAAWWVMAYYDGTLKCAIKWICRYLVSIVPAVVLFYLGVLTGALDILVLFWGIRISILSNCAIGLISYAVRKKTGNAMLVFVMVLFLYLCANPNRNSLFGTVFWGWV